MPEPWATRLITEGGGHLLVDERDLWPQGRCPTTVLVATEDALVHRRPQVKAILRAHLALTRRARAQPEAFAREANQAFSRLTGKSLAEPVLRQAFSRLELTVDPMREQLAEVATHSEALGYLPRSDVSGLVDDSLLRELEQEGVGGSGP